MPYQLVKELEPDSLLLQNEAGEKFIFDKVPFVVPPRESLRKEIQREIREIVEEEKSIKVSGLIKYISLEKYQDGFYLIRENSRQLGLKNVANGDIEGTCRALLQILRIMQIYHRNGMTMGGISVGLIKQGGKDKYFLQDPLVINYLWKSLEPEYQIENPPEVIGGERWSPESDVFSWGAIAYYLLTGIEAYSAATQEDKAAKILRGRVISLKDLKPEISMGLNKLIISCLNKNPHKRPKVENLISELTKLVENQMVVISEIEAKKIQEKAGLNRKKYEFQETIWLWFRKYGKITGISLGIIIVIIWLFLGSKPVPTITAATTPFEVLNYYFEGVKKVDVLLVDETTHKTKNNLSQMVSNIHVINTTNKAADPRAVANQIKIDVEDLQVKKLSEQPEMVKYRVDYRIKITASRVVEYLKRQDEFILEPIKEVWRITEIKVLHQESWKEEVKSDASELNEEKNGSWEPVA